MCRKAVPKGKRTADRDTIYYLQKKKQFPRCGKCLCIYNDAKWLLMYLFLVDSVDGKLFIAQFSFKNQKKSRYNLKKAVFLVVYIECTKPIPAISKVSIWIFKLHFSIQFTFLNWGTATYVLQFFNWLWSDWHSLFTKFWLTNRISVEQIIFPLRICAFFAQILNILVPISSCDFKTKLYFQKIISLHFRFARVGDNYILKPDPDEQTFRVSKIIKHGQFKPLGEKPNGDGRHDIALVSISISFG